MKRGSAEGNRSRERQSSGFFQSYLLFVAGGLNLSSYLRLRPGVAGCTAAPAYSGHKRACSVGKRSFVIRSLRGQGVLSGPLGVEVRSSGELAAIVARMGYVAFPGHGKRP